MDFVNWWTFSFLIVFAIIYSVFFLIPFLFGAPFEPTSSKKLRKIMKLANVKKGEKAVDLGSGDGRIVIELARRGVEAQGFEINPILVLISRWRIRKLGLKNAHIHWKSFWGENLGKYDVIVLFQFSTVMKRLRDKLKKELKSKARVVSFYWKFPGWKIKKKIENIFLYKLK